MTKHRPTLFALVIALPVIILIDAARPALQAAAAGISPEILSALTMSALSLIVTYAPGVSDWHAGLSPTQKRLFWLGLLAATALGWLTYQCNAEVGCIGLSAKAYFESFVRVLLSGVAAAVGTDHLATKPRRIQARAAAAKAKALQPDSPEPPAPDRFTRPD